ncbi:MAG TPA: heme-degrading domain-containing protein [Geminicoccus sp.]|jgi:uncharacterized protein (UPF0303 family)|uniref:heme-degrading domain-containing protein n=1 Tax=Geminicoccus sp. TaxID=2024832 RepID=UPI002E310877|nr:heme-degrading domain-containing protein [Geminicoccus sp.]HEX2527989.1 heme-degrading domain-containing protein [Geminicoccus sp.]
MANDEDLDALLAEEERLQFDRFDNDTALALGMLLLERAQARKLPVAIDVTRGEQQLFHAGLAGSSADNDVWVQRKARVVRRFGHSSWYIGCLARAKGYDFHAKFLLEPSQFAPSGGAFPALIRGTGLVGTIAVSGLPQREDHLFLVEVIGEFLGHQ